MIEFSVLGPIAVRVDGTPIRVPGLRQRALLALLLARHDRLVTRDLAIEHLWPDPGLPVNPANALQQVVAKLRRVFTSGAGAGTGSGHDLIATHEEGYVLRIGSHRLDTVDFERRIADARSLMRRGEPSRAADSLRAAAHLWRGRAFGELADLAGLAREAARLEELRLACLEDRADAELAAGRSAAVAAELRALASRYPHRERLHGLLMLALYRSGRQVESLAAYRAVARTLREEVGVEPGPDLRKMERRILQQDPLLVAPQPGPPHERDGWSVFQLLDAVRVFSSSADAPIAEHARLVLAVAEAANAEPARSDVAAWTASLDAMEREVDRVLDWAASSAPDVGLRLAVEVALWWDWRGHGNRAATALASLLGASTTQDGTRARALTWLGFFRLESGQRDEAHAIVAEARQLAERLGDGAAEGGAFAVESVILRPVDAEAASRCASRAVELLTHHGAARERAYALVCSALAESAAGRFDTACAASDEAAVTYAELGDRRGQAWTAGVRAQIASATGDAHEAGRLSEEAATFATHAGDQATLRWLQGWSETATPNSRSASR